MRLHPHPLSGGFQDCWTAGYPQVIHTSEKVHSIPWSSPAPGTPSPSSYVSNSTPFTPSFLQLHLQASGPFPPPHV